MPVDSVRSRYALRSVVVWDVLQAALGGRGGLDVLDAGGGTGSFAVPLAQQGHRVTVVDRSPDSLAALERRAAEAGVSSRVAGFQGDLAADLGHSGRYDVVVCHSVLEVVDDPAAAVARLAGLLRTGGIASVLGANQSGAVLGHALGGHLDEAMALLDDPAGRWGATDPAHRRFGVDELPALVAAAGLTVVAVHGVRILADHVPAALLEADPRRYDDLLRLERRLADRPEFRSVAAALHVLARRGPVEAP